MDKRIEYKKFGICIINTDRPACLTRLLASILRNTSADILKEITINVVDDSLNANPIIQIVKHFPFVNFVHTGVRIGIAKNTNRALQLVQHKEYFLLFNNDCEVLQPDWITFYYDASLKTKIHHFCFQQDGLWGAGTEKRPEERKMINDVEIKTIRDFPQGALLAFDKLAFKKVGYFDSSSFIGYGKSHWDWSFRISESGIQPSGIHDVVSAQKYYKVHNEISVTDPKKRSEEYKTNTEVFNRHLADRRSGKRSLYIGYQDG